MPGCHSVGSGENLSGGFVRAECVNIAPVEAARRDAGGRLSSPDGTEIVFACGTLEDDI